MKKDKKYRVTFTDGTKCTVKATNRNGKEINADGAWEYAEFSHGKKAKELEILW